MAWAAVRSKAEVLLLLTFLFIVTPIVGVCNCSMFCCTFLYDHSSIAIILMGKRELVALLNLSSWYPLMVKRLFLAVPRDCLRFVIVVLPDHTRFLLITFDEAYRRIYGRKFSFTATRERYPIKIKSIRVGTRCHYITSLFIGYQLVRHWM